jgi:hypothetical protein
MQEYSSLKISGEVMGGIQFCATPEHINITNIIFIIFLGHGIF